MTAVEEVRRPTVGDRLPRRPPPGTATTPARPGRLARRGRAARSGRRYAGLRLRPGRAGRHTRLHSAEARRRRLVREQLVVVAVLVAALAVTLVLLGMQWLAAGSAPSASPAPAAPASSLSPGAPT